MDGEEAENGKGHRSKLQINAGGEHQRSAGPKHKAN
jgi:hypothetical protein